MTHDELLTEINRRLEVALYNGDPQSIYALRSVVELHKPNQVQKAVWCTECSKRFENSGWYEVYPCPTIQAIEKELK